ncbi:MAG: sigma-70 family RNA polymerase sigma factor [Clostridia bacterium]|nr:sigma-70 family RNA polymerase sigma factor [Clostridia bacterium]
MHDPVNQYHSPEADIRSADTDTDSTIIDRLFARSEEGLALLQTHYGKLCHRIALNLLGSREDAEECVNDTYLAVWNTIPPNRPASLMAYVGKVTRNIAVSCLRKRGAKGRRCEGTVLLDELAECLPDTDTPDPADDLTLREALQSFFDSLSEEDRAIMVRRYYDGEPTEAIAVSLGLRHGTVRVRLHRLRERLREHLEERGVSL